MKFTRTIFVLVIAAASSITAFIFGFSIANVNNVHDSNMSRANLTKVGFLSNAEFINGLYNNLNLAEPKQVLRFVFSNLNDQVVIYPTENYYYFTFPAHGKIIFGSIGLFAYYRDEGVLFFGYYEKMDKFTEPKSPIIGNGANYTAIDGVFVKKIDDFHYSVTFESKTVIFKLNDVGLAPPRTAVLRNDEIFVGPSFDESGLKFFLIFNNATKHLYWILNEDNFVPESFSNYKENILIGNRTEFAFYNDEVNNRKILVGVNEHNILQNNWYDGPFDQMPDNYVYIGKVEIKKYLEAVYPHLKIDKYGRTLDTGVKVAVPSYLFYSSNEDLVSMISSCKGQFQGSQFYACITTP